MATTFIPPNLAQINALIAEQDVLIANAATPAIKKLALKKRHQLEQTKIKLEKEKFSQGTPFAAAITATSKKSKI
jgi:hypothetical protein